jgi:hypothetical protein
MTPKQRVQERFPLAFARAYYGLSCYMAGGAWRILAGPSIAKTFIGKGRNATAAWKDAASSIGV